MAFVMKRGDTAPILVATFKDSAGDAVLISGASVKILVYTLGGTEVFSASMSVSSEVAGTAEYEWQLTDTATPGTYLVEFEVTFADGSVETFPNTGYEMLVVKGDLG